MNLQSSTFLRSKLEVVRSFTLPAIQGQKEATQLIFDTYYADASEFSIEWATKNGGSSNVTFSPWIQHEGCVRRTQSFTISVLGKEYQCEEMHQWSFVGDRGVYEARNKLGLPFECVSEFRIEFIPRSGLCEVVASAGVFFDALPFFLACQIRNGVWSQFTTSFANMETVMTSSLCAPALAQDLIDDDVPWELNGCIITLEREEGLYLTATHRGEVSIIAPAYEKVSGAKQEAPISGQWRVCPSGLQHVESCKYLGFDCFGAICCKASSCGPWERILLPRHGDHASMMFPDWDFGRGGSATLSSGHLKCGEAAKALRFTVRAISVPGTRHDMLQESLFENAPSIAVASNERAQPHPSYGRAAVLVFLLVLLDFLGNTAAEIQ
jgi:hypothetical protein